MTDTNVLPPKNKGGRPKGSKNKAVRPVERQEVRQEARPEPKEPVRPTRAAARIIPQGLRRNDRHDEDQFFIPMNIVPEGWEYQWIRKAVMGKPDMAHLSNMQENHWEPVPKDRHPNIETDHDGMVLMERPKYVSDDARAAQFEKADRAVRSVKLNVNQAPDGTFTRNHPSVNKVAGIKRQFDMGVSVDPNEVEER